MENHVHRLPRLGDRRSLFVRVGISSHLRKKSLNTTMVRGHQSRLNGRGDRSAASPHCGDIPSPSPLLSLPFLIGVQYCADGVGLTCTMAPGGDCCLDSKTRGCAMLGRPSSAVLMCENRAAECEMLAALADSPDTERYYLGLAKGWLAHGKDQCSEAS